MFSACFLPFLETKCFPSILPKFPKFPNPGLISVIFGSRSTSTKGELSAPIIQGGSTELHWEKHVLEEFGEKGTANCGVNRYRLLLRLDF
ncbi:hypothetical protein K439DRAFT_1640778 [Ramaria rubella]|nr:hypothetical protein K439DRAFT_1640778 [Ramaria rubella]